MGESRGHRSQLLRARLAAPAPALLPAASRHGNIHPTGNAQTSAAPHHHLRLWQVCSECYFLRDPLVLRHL